MKDCVYTLTFKPRIMTCSRTYFRACIVLFTILLLGSCNKDTTYVPSHTVDSLSHHMITDWNTLALDLIPQSNGYSEPICARAMYWLNIAFYEAIYHGFPGYRSLNGQIAGLRAEIPRPDPGLEYNWIMVASHTMDLMIAHLFQAAGSQNLAKAKILRDKYINLYCENLAEDVRLRSIDLGKEIAWRLISYSDSDGQADAYLRNYPTNYTAPMGEGHWVPTPPDYKKHALLPYWGQKPLALQQNTSIQPHTKLQYSSLTNSLMYAEALEVFSAFNHLSDSQKDKIDYWNRYMSPHSTPLCHNFLLLKQFVNDHGFHLPKAAEVYLKMSLLMHDAYILAWKWKFSTNLLRPSTYIKQHIYRYFIPEVSCLPVPEFISETALIYRASAELLSHYYGHRTAFMDNTQIHRSDLRESRRSFTSFFEMAKEAAYTDIMAAVHFRSSIDAGFEMGYDLGQNIIKLRLD